MKRALLLAIPVLLLFLSSCKKEDTVTIEIHHPSDGEVIPMASANNVTVEVHITTDGDELHDFSVIMHPEGDESDKIIDFDGHEHEQEVEKTFTVDLSSYPSGTEFHIEVEACADHDCEESTSADSHFSIQ